MDEIKDEIGVKLSDKPAKGYVLGPKLNIRVVKPLRDKFVSFINSLKEPPTLQSDIMFALLDTIEGKALTKQEKAKIVLKSILIRKALVKTKPSSTIK